jgi:hypothetical protein
MRLVSTRRCPAVFLLGASLAAALWGCDRGETVTPQAIDAARARWEKAGVRDYELEWASSGLSNAHYVVAVRDGRVASIQSVAADGHRREVKTAEPRYYGVDGLFLTIRNELAQLDQPRPFGQPKGTQAVLRFNPDPQFGYPHSYRRDVLGAPMALAIDVLRFTPGTPRAAPP